MKILHIGKYYSPYKGGIESVTKILAEGSVQAGDHVDIISFSNEKDKLEVINNVNIYRYKSIKIKSQPISLKYLKAIIRNTNNYDIIHLHLPNFLGILGVIVAIAIKTKPKIVIHWHSDVVNFGYLYRIIKTLEKEIIRKSDAIITTSPNYKNHSKPLLGYEEKTYPIPIGINNVKKSNPRSIEKNKTIKVLSIGRLVPYKGFEILLRAAPLSNSNIEFTIVGDGPLKDYLRNQIISLNLEDRVFLCGSVSDSELEKLFEVSDIFCLPSKNKAEAFGVVLLEAMRHGLPLITSDMQDSGVSWVNKDNETGLHFENDNFESLSLALNKISSDHHLYRSLSAGSLRRFNQKFTSEKFIKNINELYHGKYKFDDS